MHWILWSLLANATICGVEYLNRSGGFKSFLDVVPYTAVPIIVAQIALFYTWRDAPKMLVGWVVFTIGNTIFRVASTYWFVGEPINWTVLGGVALVLAGGRVIAMGYGS